MILEKDKEVRRGVELIKEINLANRLEEVRKTTLSHLLDKVDNLIEINVFQTPTLDIQLDNLIKFDLKKNDLYLNAFESFIRKHFERTVIVEKEKKTEIVPISLEDLVRHIGLMYSSSDRATMPIYVPILQLLSNITDGLEVVSYILTHLTKSGEKENLNWLINFIRSFNSRFITNVLAWYATLIISAGFSPRELIVSDERIASISPWLYNLGSIPMAHVLISVIKSFVMVNVESKSELNSIKNPVSFASILNKFRALGFSSKYYLIEYISLGYNIVEKSTRRWHPAHLFKITYDFIKQLGKLHQGIELNVKVLFDGLDDFIGNISSNLIASFLSLYDSLFGVAKSIVSFDVIGHADFHEELSSFTINMFRVFASLIALYVALKARNEGQSIDKKFEVEVLSTFIEIVTSEGFLNQYLKAKEEVISPMDFSFMTSFGVTREMFSDISSENIFNFWDKMKTSFEKYIQDREKIESFSEEFILRVGEFFSSIEAILYIMLERLMSDPDKRREEMKKNGIIENIKDMVFESLKLSSLALQALYKMIEKLMEKEIELPTFGLTYPISFDLPYFNGIEIMRVLASEKFPIDLEPYILNIYDYTSKLIKMLYNSIKTRGDTETGSPASIFLSYIMHSIVFGSIFASIKPVIALYDFIKGLQEEKIFSILKAEFENKIYEPILTILEDFAENRWKAFRRIFLGVLWREIIMINIAKKLYEKGFISEANLIRTIAFLSHQHYKSNSMIILNILKDKVEKRRINEIELFYPNPAVGYVGRDHVETIEYINVLDILNQIILAPISRLLELLYFKRILQNTENKVLDLILVTLDYDDTIAIPKNKDKPMNTWVAFKSVITNQSNNGKTLLETLQKWNNEIRELYLKQEVIYTQYAYLSAINTVMTSANSNMRFSDIMEKIIKKYLEETTTTNSIEELVKAIDEIKIRTNKGANSLVVSLLISGGLEPLILRNLGILKLKYGELISNRRDIIINFDRVFAVSFRYSRDTTIKEFYNRLIIGDGLLILDKFATVDILVNFMKTIDPELVSLHMSESFEDMLIPLSSISDHMLLYPAKNVSEVIIKNKIKRDEIRKLKEALEIINKLDEYRKFSKDGKLLFINRDELDRIKTAIM